MLTLKHKKAGIGRRKLPGCRNLLRLAVCAGLVPAALFSQTPLTWEQIKAKFIAENPTLKAAALSIDESRAAEITAYLRPNPDLTITADGVQLTPNEIWRPVGGVYESPAISYLHERQHKRELRLANAKKSTEIAASSYLDQERGLIFNLRAAFANVLQAKAFQDNARLNLAYWDKELGVDRRRLETGDIAQVDYDRLALQRVQFESDFETATVNLRTAKIQLLMLLNDRTPIEQFDVSGPYDFAELKLPLEEFRNIALETRPDLKVAFENVGLAKLAYQLAVSNGSTDPTFTMWYSHNPSFANSLADNTMGGSISIPLRIFDRNQGEKARTQVDISRNQRLYDAAKAQVFNDVDSAYVTIVSTVNLLRPYKEQYLEMAATIRDRVSFAYQRGGASLLDYLDAEKSYRDTRLAYLNLIGSYLAAAAQMNQAVGREVL
ncbi:MAG: TolC family protein [Acidobacteriia bacterium]|nr:TolC family protein [Terriglobia bacterium]